MSDSYFIGTVARVHKLWRYAAVRKNNTKSTIDEDVLKKLLAMDDEDLTQWLKDLQREFIVRMSALAEEERNIRAETDGTALPEEKASRAISTSGTDLGDEHYPSPWHSRNRDRARWSAYHGVQQRR